LERSPYEHYVPQWTAFLEQARWHLEQQQRRDASLQQGAIAVIGFDGVLLVILVSGSALTSIDKFGVSWWATVAGVALLVLSSLAGVAAVLPRATYVTGPDDTIKAWALHKEEGGWDRVNQHFAEMLLSESSSPRQQPRRGRTTQPLLAATQLAAARAKWTASAAVCLVLGLICLAVSFVAEAAVASASMP
jgi:hypothetical protein